MNLFKFTCACIWSISQINKHIDRYTIYILEWLSSCHHLACLFGDGDQDNLLLDQFLSKSLFENLLFFWWFKLTRIYIRLPPWLRYKDFFLFSISLSVFYWFHCFGVFISCEDHPSITWDPYDVHHFYYCCVSN